MSWSRHIFHPHFLVDLRFTFLRHRLHDCVYDESPRFHPQAITDDKTLDQKLDYIHDNPVVRGLVAAPEHWRYSSAHEWLVGAEPCFRCDQ